MEGLAALHALHVLQKEHHSATMIDDHHKLQVNGSDQWVYVRGQRRGAILLFVHGGPGFPLVPIARGFERPFLDNYLVVHWDQRGMGRSFRSTDFSQGFSLDQFVADGLSVARQVQGLYPDQPITLVGHSWGTVIGVRMAAAEPSLFKAYITVGTNSHSMDAESYRYESLEEKLLQNDDLDDLSHLRKIGRPPWFGKRFEEWGALVEKHIPHEQIWGKISVDQVKESIGMCLEAEDYSDEELEEVFSKGIPQSFDRLAEDYYSFSAIEQVPRLEVPVCFLQGSMDFNTPTHIAKEYFEALEAPQGKFWIELEDSAHMVLYENPKSFLRACGSVNGQNETLHSTAGNAPI